MARALIIVPSLLKYSAGPLLGPALLVAAARAVGHDADTLDLSIRWLRERIPSDVFQADSVVVGDHDKPGVLLSEIQRNAFTPMLRTFLTDFETLDGADPHLSMTCSHDAVDIAVQRMIESPMGDWIREQLESAPEPDVFGVSVLFSGQVLLGLVTSAIAKTLWPMVHVVWGGAQVTALQDRIAEDMRYGRWVDSFVFGYAERTFVDLLDAVALGNPFPKECVRAGGRAVPRALDDATHAPIFQDLDRYGLPRLTLPAQASRGCSYGRCEFCTYPTIEGAYRPLAQSVVEPVVAEATMRGANVAFKDSLIVAKRLIALANQIRLSPMARSPQAHGIEVIGEWPWASVLGWRLASSRAMRLPLAG